MSNTALKVQLFLILIRTCFLITGTVKGVVSVVMAILPVGLGFRELALGLLLTSFLPDGIAILIAILARLLLTLYELIWVLIVTPRKGTFSRLVRR